MSKYAKNYPVIDTYFTSVICNNRDSGIDTVTNLMTADEFDFLLDGDDEGNEAYVTKLAEEIILRAHGVHVDLALEGPATLNIASCPLQEGNLHNSILIMKPDVKIREYPLDSPDAEYIPKITPEDVNRAVTSIDYDSRRPRLSKIEGIHLNSRECPIERCFMNAVMTIQTLNEWEVVVPGLVAVVDRIWGIDYTQQLVDRLALACTDDVSAMLASGGRPDPSIYICANYTTLYQMVSKPSYDAKAMGVSNIFFSRSKQLAKFIHLMTDMCIGPPGLPSMAFSVNPAQFAAFDPAALSGTYGQVQTVGEPSGYAHMIPNIASCEEFVSSRQSVKQTLDITTKSVANITLAINSLDMTKPVMKRSQRRIARQSTDMIDSSVPGLVDESYAWSPEEARPSHVLSVLTGMFHKAPSSEMYQPVTETCLLFMAMCTMLPDSSSMHNMWGMISHGPGFATLLRNVSMTRAANLPGGWN